MSSKNIKKNKGESFFTTPNILSFSRIPLLFIAAYALLYNLSPIVSFILILVIFLMDLADGYIARLLKEETRFGEAVDEIVDRIVENVLFIVFAYLQYIPIWIPLIMIVRAFVVDGTVFYHRINAPTAKKSESYKALIRSDISRGGYGFAKMLLFSVLAFYPILDSFAKDLVLALAVFVVLFSVFRGIIKIREAKK